MKIKTIIKTLLIIGLAGAIQIQAMKKHHNKKQLNKTTRFLTNNKKNRCRDKTKPTKQHKRKNFFGITAKDNAVNFLNILVKTNKDSEELLLVALPIKNLIDNGKRFKRYGEIDSMEYFIDLNKQLRENKIFIRKKREKQPGETKSKATKIIESLKNTKHANLIIDIKKELKSFY